jgi:dTDP-4-dehydrorhamnose 3,5-epimerase
VDKIEGVILTPLRQIDTPKGSVWHAMKSSDVGFDGFGEAYFSFVNKGEIKGWKKHVRMTLNIVVPIGSIKFRLIDGRDGSVTNGMKNEFVISASNYQRLTAPPGVWMCFEGVGEHNMLLNLANTEHDSSEVVNKELGELPL